MVGVNREIVARMHSPVALIPELAGHIVAAGGQTPPPAANAGDGAHERLHGRAPYWARRLR